MNAREAEVEIGNSRRVEKSVMERNQDDTILAAWQSTSTAFAVKWDRKEEKREVCRRKKLVIEASEKWDDPIAVNASLFCVRIARSWLGAPKILDGTDVFSSGLHIRSSEWVRTRWVVIRRPPALNDLNMAIRIWRLTKDSEAVWGNSRWLEGGGGREQRWGQCAKRRSDLD